MTTIPYSLLWPVLGCVQCEFESRGFFDSILVAQTLSFNRSNEQVRVAIPFRSAQFECEFESQGFFDSMVVVQTLISIRV